MNNEHFFRLVEEICDISQIQIDNIPDVDLYMDQVTTFTDEKLNKLKRNETDSILTKTMINNYTKDKIVPPPVKKKYSKQHMMYLILIYHLKQILSIQDIHQLFSNTLHGHDELLQPIYEAFLSLEKQQYSHFNETVKNQFENLQAFVNKVPEEKKESFSYLLMVMSLIVSANAQKRLAEKLINEYFKR